MDSENIIIGVSRNNCMNTKEVNSDREKKKKGKCQMEILSDDINQTGIDISQR